MAASNTQLLGRVPTDDKLCKVGATALTVWKKSPMFNCNGFTVFDPSGNLVFRVESYIRSNPEHEVVLMDAAGIPLLTMQRRKRLGLHNEWKGFLGEYLNVQKSLFMMRKSVSLIPTKTLAKVYVGSLAKHRKLKLQYESLHIDCTMSISRSFISYNLYFLYVLTLFFNFLMQFNVVKVFLFCRCSQSM